MQVNLRKKPTSRELELLENIQQAIFPPHPRSFAALMEMYEINYMQLRLLCGDIQSLSGVLISQQSTGIPLKLEVLEQSRHTTILVLTYAFENGAELRPDLHIQIYHDSRQANVISRRCKLLGKQMDTRQMRTDTQLLCHWRTNRFLFKWMKYLRRQNYSF
ncbi:MAG: hypothetical protein CSB47_02060 [Proteobacteria bacterium]|nr:MAG: hypothetical protein CSB47_02060 [Pseudomonadota bacterium]